jgi:hypothetical protein
MSTTSPTGFLLGKSPRSVSDEVVCTFVGIRMSCKDWKKVFRSKHVEDARFVVRQLIGPITLLAGGKKKPAYLKHDGPPRGAEGIEFSESSFAAEITPFGLTSGLAGALNVIVGARNRQYRQHCTWWLLEFRSVRRS